MSPLTKLRGEQVTGWQPDELYVIVVDKHANYKAAFMLDQGEMLETVEFKPNGEPNWNVVEYCDEIRGLNPPLQRAVMSAIMAQASGGR